MGLPKRDLSGGVFNTQFLQCLDNCTGPLKVSVVKLGAVLTQVKWNVLGRILMCHKHGGDAHRVGET
jgi:hypothetical protein